MFKRSKEPEKKGSEKREDLLVSFLKDAHFVFAIICVMTQPHFFILDADYKTFENLIFDL